MIKSFLFKLVISLFWVGAILAFAYPHLFSYFLLDRGEKCWDNVLVTLINSIGALVVNAGIVAMIFFDFCVSEFKGSIQSSRSGWPDGLVYLTIINIFGCIVLYFFAVEHDKLYDWMKVSYIFYIFVGLLVWQKITSLGRRKELVGISPTKAYEISEIIY